MALSLSLACSSSRKEPAARPRHSLPPLPFPWRGEADAQARSSLAGCEVGRTRTGALGPGEGARADRKRLSQARDPGCALCRSGRAQLALRAHDPSLPSAAGSTNSHEEDAPLGTALAMLQSLTTPLLSSTVFALSCLLQIPIPSPRPPVSAKASRSPPWSSVRPFLLNRPQGSEQCPASCFRR